MPGWRQEGNPSKWGRPSALGFVRTRFTQRGIWQLAEATILVGVTVCTSSRLRARTTARIKQTRVPTPRMTVVVGAWLWKSTVCGLFSLRHGGPNGDRRHRGPLRPPETVSAGKRRPIRVLGDRVNPAEQIAEITWERIKQSRDVRVRLGEETLSDLLILDFVRLMGNRTKLFQSTKIQEARRGTDLEIRIHKGGNRAIAIVVQAKKLYPSQRYDDLNAKVKSSRCFQIDVLERYARSMCAIPLYLLYNYVDLPDLQSHWHCCKPLDQRQLGCTLVPSWNIRRAIETHGCRKFDWIHESSAALPWRCLFDCPQGREYRLLPSAERSLSIFLGKFLAQADETQDYDLVRSGNEQTYDWVRFEPVDGGGPDWLWSRDDATLSDDDVRRLQQEIRRGERSLRPWEGSDSKVRRGRSASPSSVPRHSLLVKEEAE